MVHSELTGHVGWRYHLLLLPISWTMNCLCLPSKSPWGLPGGAEEYQEQPGPAECGRRRCCLWPGPHHGWGHVTEPRGTWKVPTETSRPASSPRNSMGALAHTGLGEHVEEEGGVLRHSRDVLGLPLACVLCFSKERPDHHLSLLQKNPSRLWQLMNLGGTSQSLASHSVTQLPTQLPSVLQPKGRSHSCGSQLQAPGRTDFSSSVPNPKPTPSTLARVESSAHGRPRPHQPACEVMRACRGGSCGEQETE